MNYNELKQLTFELIDKLAVSEIENETIEDEDVIANALGCLKKFELENCPRNDSEAVLVKELPMALEVISDGI